jgi:hypothetical protein
MTTAEITDPLTKAAERLPDLDPAYVARVVGELRAGPITPDRARQAVHELAGLGHVVEVETTEVVEVDGEWFGAGRVVGSRRSVCFSLHEITASEVADYLATGPATLPVVAVPPVALVDLPAELA